MIAPLLIAKSKDKEIHLLPQLANRHGLITGATGTGKTVALQKLSLIHISPSTRLEAYESNTT